MARARTVFPRDSGLQFRMLLTLFLLGLLYAVFVAVLLAAGAGVGIMVVVIVGLALARRAPRKSRPRTRRACTR